MKVTLAFVAIVLASYCLCESSAHVADFSGVKGTNNITALFHTPSTLFFQLQAQSNGKCLKLTANRVIYVNCSDRESTIYFRNGNNIVIFGTSHCLDRERYHSSYSNLRYSVCDHCEAKNWDIKSDGSLRDGKLLRWPWRSRVIPVWLLLPPCVVMPVPVLPPPSLQFCIGRHASCCPPSRQFLSSHLRHSSRCVRISIIPVFLSPHSSDLPSSVVTPVAVLHHSSEGLSST